MASASYWHSRGYLPHFESGLLLQHVTYHLADSLPHDVVTRLDAELRDVAPEHMDAERRTWLEAWIDAGHGSCVLKESAIAELVQESFLHHDAERYQLLAWVIMPNHVHVLLQPIGEWTLDKIVASWKSFSGRRIAEYMRQKQAQAETETETQCQAGAWRSHETRHSHEALRSHVWQREYWDRFIRNEQHLAAIIQYIHENPVKAGLVATAEEWRWGSARLQPGSALAHGSATALAHGSASALAHGSARLQPGSAQ